MTSFNISYVIMLFPNDSSFGSFFTTKVISRYILLILSSIFIKSLVYCTMYIHIPPTRLSSRASFRILCFSYHKSLASLTANGPNTSSSAIHNLVFSGKHNHLFCTKWLAFTIHHGGI
jgi:hypothetical protein